ncbi:MFS general substrate transporter [Coniophora puteana RWD-64-598 SS2]|uniref:MFS general substrate transporter n=1 Tax=Coniophora puteana (strain RWD-64-598) TaxID=741705 RepID=A0A5M3MJK0_CONPW|nr:MFS general substrate transporter [Coniophora puteana RWD-64-598 SS2]EIW79418.1 MFS general substrate transporter [Coniophora puteana RWD-64-598 SS2]
MAQHEDVQTEVAARDERTPLIQAQPQSQSKIKKPRTPLPKVQVGILSLVQLVEPISSQSIYPYINQLIRELDVTHGDERRVGYYAGLIESLFFVTQALTTLSWSRLSDHIGRKPVILIGLSGLCISMLCFGLSRTFTTLVLSRCICGMLNGNLGVMKSMMGELTDSTNMAQGMSLIPIVWCVGATLGPFVGGVLVKPADRWPHVFSNQFWREYPYFLPCLAASVFTVFAILVIALFLKETLPSKKSKKPALSEASEDPRPATEDAPLPMRALFVPSILIPVGNYGLLAFTEIAYLALQPLFYSTPTELGGLGFSPAIIGLWLGLFGLFDGLTQALFFAPIVNRVGAKWMFNLSNTFFIPIIALFPIMSWYVTRWGVDTFIWACLALQLIFQIIMDMAFGCIVMHTTAAAPSKRSLGSVNGLGQTVAATARAVGPALATSIFAASKQYNLLGGNLIYVLMLAITFSLLYLGSMLPDELPDRD